MTTVSEAIKKRHSARAFKDRDVDLETVKNIIQIAKQSPSGVNTQPWNVYVLSGDARDKLVNEATSRYDQGKMDGQEYLVYPKEMPDWYKERRRAVGWAMYGAIGIEKGDTEKMMAQGRKNYVGPNGWGHVGHFIQNVCLLAIENGLATCLQEAWAELPKLVREHVNYPEDETLWCGIALGYEDESDPVNQFRTEREDLENFSKFFK
jgi:nitroreductase